MDNLYTETIYLSNITASIRIYKNANTAEIYFYRNNSRFMYHVWVYVLSGIWMSIRVYRDKDDMTIVKKYPQYINDIASAVADVIRAHNNNEINLGREGN